MHDGRGGQASMDSIAAREILQSTPSFACHETCANEPYDPTALRIPIRTKSIQREKKELSPWVEGGALRP